MGRTGLNKIVGKCECDMLGMNSMFRILCNAIVEKHVSEGIWFSFCTKVCPEQADVMSYVNNKGIKLGTYIKDEYPDSSYRTSIYKYLVRDFLCYYESPTISRDSDGHTFKSTYNKYLITSSLYVIAEWLGITLEEADMQYGYRIYDSCDDNGTDLFPYVKLYESKGVRKITIPRKDLDLGISGTRVVPLFALKTGMDVLYEKAKQGTYDINFYKDSGHNRTINVSFNAEIIRSIYKNDSYVLDNYQSQYDGDFLENPFLERGYMRVFELGASKYDSPLRSINYARIVSFKEAEPDLAYIDIDIDSVLSEFKRCVATYNIDIKAFVSMLDVYEVGTERKIAGHDLRCIQDLEDWADTQYSILGTVFLRKLSLFMIGNPNWFDGYTGEPRNVYSAEDVDIDEADFGLDLW